MQEIKLKWNAYVQPLTPMNFMFFCMWAQFKFNYPNLLAA